MARRCTHLRESGVHAINESPPSKMSLEMRYIIGRDVKAENMRAQKEIEDLKNRKKKIRSQVLKIFLLRRGECDARRRRLAGECRERERREYITVKADWILIILQSLLPRYFEALWTRRTTLQPSIRQIPLVCRKSPPRVLQTSLNKTHRLTKLAGGHSLTIYLQSYSFVKYCHFSYYPTFWSIQMKAGQQLNLSSMSVVCSP